GGIGVIASDPGPAWVAGDQGGSVGGQSWPRRSLWLSSRATVEGSRRESFKVANRDPSTALGMTGQYFRNDVTGVGSSFLRPCRNSSSIKKIASIKSPPTFLISVAAEALVPPVASKSSINTIFSPCSIASMCNSISASPYSSEYLALSVR